MAGILNNAVKAVLCDRQTSGPLFTALILGLGTADILPTPATTLGQLVEALWPGYLRQTIRQRWTPAVLTVDDVAFSATDVVTWNNPGPLATPPNYCWFYYDIAASRVVLAGRFPAAVVIAPGGSYSVSPSWTVTGL